jgi:hypothetical protein
VDADILKSVTALHKAHNKSAPPLSQPKPKITKQVRDRTSLRLVLSTKQVRALSTRRSAATQIELFFVSLSVISGGRLFVA